MELIGQKLVLHPLGVSAEEVLEELGVADGSEHERGIILMGLRAGDEEGFWIYEQGTAFPNRYTFLCHAIDPQACFERGENGQLNWREYHRRQDNSWAFERADNPEVITRPTYTHELPHALGVCRPS